MEGQNITLESLAAQLQALQDTNKTQQELNLSLQESNEALKEQNAVLLEQNNHLKTVVTKLDTTSSVTTEPAKLPALPDNAIFQLGKQKYKLLAPSCHIPGIGYMTAEDILVSTEAQKVLVDRSSGIIRKVV